MIYIKNTTEIQTIFIPRNELQKEAYITSTKTYEDGYREGLEDGKEQQKDQLLNLYVTENGQYEREDGWGVVTVDMSVPDCSGAYDEGYKQGYEDGQNSVECPEGGSCNLEEIGIRPSMGDRDGNGVIVVSPNEGFDGLSRVVLDPTTIYNEGVSAGKAEGGDLNIDAVSTSLGVGTWNKWTRTAAQYGLDGITEITIDGSQYQEWTKALTLLQAYQNTEETYITENGEYRANIGYDGYALNGYNVGWVIDVIPTIDTDVEIWVKPYDGAPNSWQGFIGSQVSDDDNTTFQIRKMDGNNAFSFKFGELTYDYWFEYERWYRLRMNRNGVWVNGEQVCGWDVQAFEENPNPLMINGIYNLNFENENYRMNFASYGYVYFHNTDSLLVPFNNGLFIGNKNQTIGRPAADGATLRLERNWYPKGYTKVIVDVPQNGGNTNIYEAFMVNDLLMWGDISYGNNYIFKGQITEIQRIRPDIGDARYTLDGSLNVYNGQTMGYDIQVGDNVIVVGTLSEYNGSPQLSAGSMIKAWWREGGSGNCDDAYNQGYNDGQATCEPCNLQHLEVTENGYYEPRAEEFGCLEVRENSAFDTGVRLLENSTIEILFNAGENWNEIPTLIGCEDSDWNSSTFAARWYMDTLFVRIGNSDRQIPLTPEDFWSKLHKLKFGRFEGVWFDDEYIGSLDWTDWVITQNTIYIGAMHNTTDSENGIWRPWNGYISNVTIYGEKNGENRDWHFEAGDFGKWGEFKCVETDEILPNLLGDGGATHMCCKQYGEPQFRGYSSVSVNIPAPHPQGQINEYDVLALEFETANWLECHLDTWYVKDCNYNETDCILVRTRVGNGWLYTKQEKCSGQIKRLQDYWLMGKEYLKKITLHRVGLLETGALISYHLTEANFKTTSLGIRAIDAPNLTKITSTIYTDTLIEQYNDECFLNLPTEGTITLSKLPNVTLSDEDITTFFRTRVPEGWSITIE